MIRKLVLFLTLIISFPLLSMETYFCDKNLESLPILEGGRLKPLYVTGEESIKYLVGKYKTEGLTRTQMYCLLSLKEALKKDALGLKIKIEHVKILELLGLTQNDPEITYEKLSQNSQQVRFAVVREKRETSLKKALEKLLNQIHLYEKISNGEHWVLPKKINGNIEWLPLISYFTEEDFNGVHSQGVLFENIKKDFISQEGDKYLFELYFLKPHLPGWCLLFTLMALASMVLFKNFKIVLALRCP
jgi:hypothetical protein